MVVGGCWTSRLFYHGLVLVLTGPTLAKSIAIVLRLDSKVAGINHGSWKLTFIIIFTIFLHPVYLLYVPQLLDHHALLLTLSQGAILADLQLAWTISWHDCFTATTAKILSIRIDASRLYCIRLIAAKICRRLSPLIIIDIFHIKIVCRAFIVLDVPADIRWAVCIEGRGRRVRHADTECVAPFLRLIVPSIRRLILLTAHSQGAVWRHVSFDHSVESARCRWLDFVFFISVVTLAIVSLYTTAVCVPSKGQRLVEIVRAHFTLH